MLETVEIKITCGEGASMPTYATEAAAGMDLYSREPVTLSSLERKLVGTGLRLAIPNGYEGQVRP
ncbi:MAG TPA: hypothetical protein VEX38_01195, partial [Fimbriimonadaceae bacterium]|nr:hypothetical protein [Fimbriimonadaceae bacterium]